MKNLKNFMIEKQTIKIDEGVRRTGKDEMNLIELPFTLLTKRNPNGLKTIERNWIGKDINGKDKKFHKIITGSDKWGLPTFIGEELYLACMELSSKQGFKSRTVHASKYEIIKLMGWVVNGESYKRVTKAFNQLGGLWITTNAFWDNQDKKYREIGFGIIDDYMFFEEEKKRRKNKYKQSILPLGNFNWNEKFFKHSIQKGNIKTLDIEVYFSLKSYISKRLYRYADKKIFQQQTFELDLFRLAFEKLEMTGNYKYPSEIIRKLQPAIEELKERGIANIAIKKSKTESDYKVCFGPIKKQQVMVDIIVEEKQNFSNFELLKYFHQKITPEIKDYIGNDKEAQQLESLLLKHSKDEILYIIDYAIDQAKQTKFAMQHFGAVLNYKDKAIIQLQQKIEQKEKAEKLKAKQVEYKKLKETYDIYCQKQVDEYVNRLDSDEYTTQLEKIGDKLLKSNSLITNKKSKIFQHLLASHYQVYLVEQNEINILPYEEWMKRK